MKISPGRLKIIAAFLLFLLLVGYPSAAFLQQGDEPLLQEIENYIRSYYLYQPNEEFLPLRSLEDLSKVFQDPYSMYLDKERMAAFKEGLERGIPGGVGIYLEQKDSQIVVKSVVKGSPADRAGIQSGDIIVSVDDILALNLSVEEVVLRLRGETGTGVRLFVRRDNEVLSFDMLREKIDLPSVEYTWEDEGIALVKFYTFGADLAEETAQVLEELKTSGLRGLILDLRDNQGGYVEEARAVCSLFTDGVLLKVKEKNSSWQEIRGPDRWKPVSLPTVVLVNGETASAGEIMAAALKDNKAALLVGESTFGKGTMQTLFELSDGGYLKLTTAEFTSPEGRTIQDNGVEPHFFVFPEEEQYQTALELLNCWLDAKGPFLKSVQINNQTCYPLRASLLRTGRGIATGEQAGVYLFYWDKQLYRLDLREKKLTWEDSSGMFRRHPVLLEKGTTYVQGEFLEEVLGLPFY